MTAEEIHKEIGEGVVTTLKNSLTSDPRFQRRGTYTWGLVEWGGGGLPEHRGRNGRRAQAPERRDADRPGQTNPHREFDISAASVEIMSATHPRFVREGVGTLAPR